MQEDEKQGITNNSVFKIIYFDRSRGEKLIHNALELKPILDEFQLNSYPESINLESPNGDLLTIAIGSEFGFIQYTCAQANKPYLIAIDKTKRDKTDEFWEVDAGGTPTPIPAYACLPAGKIIEIVMYYLEHLDIPENIDWEAT